MTSPEGAAPQAIELATAYVSIVGETDKLARSVKTAMRDAQRHADANPLELKANVDVSHIGAVEVPVTADTSAFTRQARDAFDDVQKHATANPIEIKAHVDITHSGPVNIDVNADASRVGTAVRQEMAAAQAYADANPLELKANIDVSHIGTVQIPVEPNTSHFAQQLLQALRQMEASGLFRFHVPIDLDEAAALARFAALRQALEGMATPIRQEVDVDVDRSALDRLQSLGSLGGLSKGALGASAVAAAIATIGGAAGAALGAVSALGVGLVALGPAAAAAASTVAVGLQGIGDAFKALSAADDAAATDGAARAKAVAAAQKQVETAIKGVTSAEKDLKSAKKDGADAEQDLTQARKDAQDQLEDYQLTLADAALSEKEAALALKEAQKDVFDAKTPEEREKALLRVERAQLSYQKAVDRNRDTQEEAAEAERKGVEGADNVVAAKEKVADANDRIAEAEQKLADAHAQVSEAQAAVAEAANSSSSAQTKAAQAFAELSPNAQAFVLATRELAPAWDDLKGAVQDNLFDGAAEGITELAKSALPTLKAGMVDVAQSVNMLTRDFADFWQAPQNLDAVREIFRGTADAIGAMSPGLQQMTTGFLSLGQAFAPVAEKVGAQFGGMLGQIGQAFTDTFQNGQLTQLISTFGDILQGLGEGLNPLIQGLIQIGNIVGPTIGPLFAELGKSIQSMAPALGQLGATFATTLTAIMPDLSKFISALATGLEPVLPVIGDLLQSLMTTLTPLVPHLSQIAQVVGTALSQALTALTPAIGPIGEAFASLITAVAPILPVIAEVVAGLIQALAPALTTIFEALAPVITQIADLMMPVFKQLEPILADVAMQIANALVEGIEQLAPHLPAMADSFSKLVLALAPLLPQLVEIGVQLLPPLLDLFIAILPQIQMLTDALTWLAKNVLEPIVIPVIALFGENLGKVMEFAATAINTARDTIGAALSKMGEFFTGLGSTVKEQWDRIVGYIKGGVREVGKFLVRLPEIEIPDIPGVPGRGTKVGFKPVGQSMIDWANEGMATGGLFRGAGSGTSDSNLIRVSDGEFIVNAAATGANLPLLQAINDGWVPSARDMHRLFPGFMEGGLVPGKKFAQSMDPVPYEMGGFSKSSIDCSGMVSAVVNDAMGEDPFASRMSTVSEGEWLAARGAEWGLGGPGDISIGWFDNGGGANGHTAMTLGDGTNVESRGGDGVVVGADAAGADDPMFTHHAHIPKELLRGGDLGDSGDSGSRKGGRSSKLGASPGGSGGSGGSGGGFSAGESGEANGLGGGGAVVDVFVTNMPSGGIGVGGTTSSVQADPAVTTSTITTPSGVLSEQAYGPTTPAAPTAPADQGTHPLASLPIPGADALFNGPAPWYMAATPEQAVANLGTQAASLAMRTGEGFASFVQDNWREMLNTGLAVAGMGAVGGGGQVTNYNISGTDPMSAAAAVDRVQRRRTMAMQRSGGFGR